ncbi:MAG TPA: class I SAM-dependent methyltransferase [Wenzhouxiangellaceae bacterium]|nr:class I SAM-dependent methyltransferase [Wenzhouxiangellaceae bacterium]
MKDDRRRQKSDQQTIMQPVLKASETDPSVSELLARAERLEASDRDEAGRLYFEALRRDPANLVAHNSLERLEDPRRYGAWMLMNCSIHPDDDIYKFFVRDEVYTLNPVRDYLSDGWRTMSETMQVLENIDRPLMKVSSFLEFASGFGRFTRHLARALPGRVTCSDVLPGSVDFVRQHFGVEAFESSFDPEAIRFPARYDVVFVLSLFTHLPVPAWNAWLRALRGAVAPGGVLLFSVHSEALAREELGVTLNEDGYCYLPHSESPSLDPDKYGTTLTTRQLVIDQVRSALGTEPALYQPGAFWSGQDAVAVMPDNTA